MTNTSCSSSGQRVRLITVVAVLFFVAGTLFAGGQAEGSTRHSGTIHIVAAENFYGDVASQLAGHYAKVTSIISDPNVDPHEYESNVRDAKSIASANLVIENGGGYDAWMDKLLSASANTSRLLINGYDISPIKLPDNDHVWYNIENVQTIAKVIVADLKKLDPAHASYFDRNLQTFTESLGQITAKMNQISAKYAGTPIALTETIFLYQTMPMALKVLTPFAFEKAIAEGNDPPADTVVVAENQLKNKLVRVLVYNEQTVDRVTDRLRNEANAQGIPVVPVTETMPKGKHYQSWMMDQLAELEQALAGKSAVPRGKTS